MTRASVWELHFNHLNTKMQKILDMLYQLRLLHTLSRIMNARETTQVGILCFIYEFQIFLMFMVDAYFLSTHLYLSLDATSMYTYCNIHRR